MSNEDYRKGYQDGFKDGMAIKNPPVTPNPITYPPNPWELPKVPPFPYNPSPAKQKDYCCPVCGITFEFGKAYGYYCVQQNCPTKITSMNTSE